MTALIFVVAQPVLADGGNPPVRVYDEVINGPNGETLYVEIFDESGQPDFPQEVLDENILAGGGCKSITHGVAYYDATNFKVFQYAQRTDWCFDGTKITSLSHTHLPSVYAPLYKYLGLIGHTHSGGVGQASYRAFSQANFCAYAPLYGCYWYRYPWVDQRVYKNGTFSASAGW